VRRCAATSEIGAVYIAMLAVASAHQGRGIGALLLANALKRIKRLGEETGTWAVILDALNPRAEAFLPTPRLRDARCRTTPPFLAVGLDPVAPAFPQHLARHKSCASTRYGKVATWQSPPRPTILPLMTNPTDTPNHRLRAILAPGAGILLPGAANALAARVIAAAGFEAVYVTGAGVANTFLGVPDLGLVTVSELAEQVAAISDGHRPAARRRRRYRLRQRPQHAAAPCACSSAPAPARCRSRTRSSPSAAAISPARR